jgi:hypothetical protein
MPTYSLNTMQKTEMQKNGFQSTLRIEVTPIKTFFSFFSNKKTVIKDYTFENRAKNEELLKKTIKEKEIELAEIKSDAKMSLKDIDKELEGTSQERRNSLLQLAKDKKNRVIKNIPDESAWMEKRNELAKLKMELGQIKRVLLRETGELLASKILEEIKTNENKNVRISYSFPKQTDNGLDSSTFDERLFIMDVKGEVERQISASLSRNNVNVNDSSLVNLNSTRLVSLSDIGISEPVKSTLTSSQNSQEHAVSRSGIFNQVGKFFGIGR